MKYLLLLVILAGCADDKTINGITYRPYGLINESDCKNDSVHYEVAVDATIAGVVFCETLIAPVYIFGFNLWEPVCMQKDFVPGQKSIK